MFLRFDRKQLLHVLSTANRPQLVCELIAAVQHSPRALEVRFVLPNLLHPKTDAETLMQLINDAGIEAARVIVSNLDASPDGFVDAFATLGARWGEDEEVRRGLM